MSHLQFGFAFAFLRRIARKIGFYRSAVLVLWLSTTFWLVDRKIVPTLLIGEPPAYATPGKDRQRPVAWYLNLNESRLGWALSDIGRQTTDVTEIHSLVHFDGLPWDQLLPTYLREVARASIQAANSIEMEVESHMLINPLNQLQSFDTKLRFRPNMGQSLVAIEGNVEGDALVLNSRCGNYPQEKITVPMPDHKIRDSFSPETELRGLRLGQKWTIVSYSPLSLPSNALDLLQHRAPTVVLLAEVEEKKDLMWNGKMEPAWLVVYRSDTSQSPGSESTVRNRMWVRVSDGTVIREEVFLGGNTLTFSRMSEKDAAELRSRRKEFVTEPL
jgi:hypothetical protein